jgi:hypothetical protein
MDTVKEVKRASLPEDVALITATIPRGTRGPGANAAGLRDKIAEGSLRARASRRRDGFGRRPDWSSAWVTMFTSCSVRSANIKITKPADMELARFFLERERAKS